MVHLIDRALEVPSKTLLEALSSNKKYSKFYNLIKAANMTNLFGQKNTDLLVLVPTNDVFQEQKEYYEEILSNPSLLNTLVKTHIVPGKATLIEIFLEIFLTIILFNFSDNLLFVLPRIPDYQLAAKPQRHVAGDYAPAATQCGQRGHYQV